MDDKQITDQLMSTFLATQSPWGRWRVNFYARWKRQSWRLVVSGALLVKRLFDLLASAAFLVVFSPLFLLIALLIKLEDRGPIFFAQRRVGRFGREFKMLKFRSMCVDAEARMKELLARNQH